MGAETFLEVEGNTFCPVTARDTWSTGVIDYGTSYRGAAGTWETPAFPFGGPGADSRVTKVQAISACGGLLVERRTAPP